LSPDAFSEECAKMLEKLIFQAASARS